VQAFASHDEATIPTLRIDETVAQTQIESLQRIKSSRDAARVASALQAVRASAQATPGSEGSNLMPPIIEAAKAYCTQQEICDVLRDVFGSHSDRAEF
jgi:methylmalonyl-CoA mutase N-terminal domain/subunit